MDSHYKDNMGLSLPWESPYLERPSLSWDRALQAHWRTWLGPVCIYVHIFIYIYIYDWQLKGWKYSHHKNNVFITVMWHELCLKSTSTQLFVQQLEWTSTKENVKDPHCWHFVNPWTPGNAWVRSQHCGYWCPGAKAPGHQYPQCWLNIHCIGPVSYITLIMDNIRK